MRARALGVIGSSGGIKNVSKMLRNIGKQGISDMGTHFEFAAKNNAKCLNSNFYSK